MVMLNSATRKQYIVGIAMIALAAIGLYVILPQLGDFDRSWQALSNATGTLILIAIGFSLLSSVFSAGLYGLLSYKPLRLTRSVLVQLSGLLVNRILPAGIGGLGLNFLYLRAEKHSVTQATTVVALNNIIGLLGHVLLAIIIIFIYPLATDTHLDVSFESPAASKLTLAVVLAVIIAVLAASHLMKSKLKLATTNTKKALKSLSRHYTTHPVKLVFGVLLSCMLTLSNVLSLWFCCQALGISMSFVAVFVVFTFGIAIGTVTPTPGGVGGAEAALTAGLISQNISPPLALAAALLYRLVSYWLGLIVGLVAFVIVQSRHIIRA